MTRTIPLWTALPIALILVAVGVWAAVGNQQPTPVVKQRPVSCDASYQALDVLAKMEIPVSCKISGQAWYYFVQTDSCNMVPLYTCYHPAEFFSSAAACQEACSTTAN